MTKSERAPGKQVGKIVKFWIEVKLSKCLRQNPAQWIVALACVVLSLSVSAEEVPDAKPLPGGLQSVEVEVEEIRRYSVEVIVFEYTSNASGGNEIFESLQPEPEIVEFGSLPESVAVTGQRGEVIEYGDSRTGPGSEIYADLLEESDEVLDKETELELIPTLSSVEFRLLNPEELTMGGIHEKLLDLDAYQPVLWGGWVQAVYEHETTPPVRLRVLGTPPLHIDGTLSLYLKNYLHLAVDITRELRVATVQPIYRQEKPGRRGYGGGSHTAYGVTETEILLFQIQEDRIFNSGHLRYYDHPKFGLLAKVNRYEEIPDEDLENLPLEEDDPAGPELLSRSYE